MCLYKDNIPCNNSSYTQLEIDLGFQRCLMPRLFSPNLAYINFRISELPVVNDQPREVHFHSTELVAVTHVHKILQSGILTHTSGTEECEGKWALREDVKLCYYYVAVDVYAPRPRYGVYVPNVLLCKYYFI